MLEQEDANQKKMMLFMRFARIVAAALCALGLLYLVHQHQQKKAATTENAPTQQVAPTSPQPSDPQTKP